MRCEWPQQSVDATTLREVAGRLVSYLKLEELVLPFGQLELVGSAALDLMTWRDVDLQVRMDHGREPELWRALINHFIGIEQIRRLNAIKFLGDYRPDMSRGWCLGIYLLFEGHEWKVDLWALTEEEQARSDLWLAEVRERLDPSSRDLILTVKQHLMVDGRVPQGLSRRLYQLVLLDGVHDPEELLTRLRS
jgi:hypothetical protein